MPNFLLFISLPSKTILANFCLCFFSCILYCMSHCKKKHILVRTHTVIKLFFVYIHCSIQLSQKFSTQQKSKFQKLKKKNAKKCVKYNNVYYYMSVCLCMCVCFVNNNISIEILIFARDHSRCTI